MSFSGEHDEKELEKAYEAHPQTPRICRLGRARRQKHEF